MVRNVRSADETLCRRIVEATNVGIWVLDGDGRTVFANDKTSEMLGYPPEEMAELTLFDVLDEEGRKQAARNLERRRQGVAAQLECAFHRRDGSRAWVLVNTTPLLDDDGRYVGGVSMMSEITERKHIEDALARATARSNLLHAMAYAANDASSVAEVLQTALDAVCTHTGWPVGHAFVPDPDDGGRLVSSGIWHVDPPEARFDALRAVTARTSFGPGESVVGRQLVHAAPAWVGDVTLDPDHRRAVDEPAIGVRTHVAVPVRLGADTIGVLEFFSPEALPPDEELLATLDRVGVTLARVAERERANAALAAARDHAMESSRAKSDFLATMSHEIRTPMNAVIGLTGLLLRTELDDRQREYAEGVHGAGEALLAIINDILDFSKIEAGKVELETVDFDVVRLVEEAAGLVADAARRKGLELVAYCYPNLPPALRGDPGRLRQVLLNLASNAVKFTERGEVVVRARPIATSDDAVTVTFEVVDTGPGVREADRQRLFEPFSQADVSTTRRFGGTGLGLAICSRLVTTMGGTIGVDSERGRGSRFWFTVQLERAAAAVEERARPAAHVLEGRRVLVVDDNETNRAILQEQLEAWDMRPTPAADGATALRMLREAADGGRPYELAILDMFMPGMDGVEVARTITGDPALASTAMALLTSTSGVPPVDVEEAGIAVCLTKPVRLSQLYDALARLSVRGRAAAEPADRPAAGVACGRGHVLVVEDNATNQMVAVGLLEALGYSADVADDGLQALHALDRTEYDVVLMDCQMPEMDGYTATGHIRRRPHVAGVPVIAMTAGAIAGDRERCLAAGMDDYVTKPVKPDALEAALARWTGRTGGAAGGDGAPGGGGNGASGGGGAGGSDGEVDVDRLEELRRLGSGDGSLLADIVDVLTAQAPGMLAAVVDAVAAGDASAVQRAAHRLGGSAANVGATGVASVCAELERLARSGELAGAPALLARLEPELAGTLDRLRTFAEGRRPGDAPGPG